MKFSKKVKKVIFGIALIVFGTALFVSIWPIVSKVSADLKAYETHVAYRDNYKLHTTPLSEDVVDDICLKLEIKVSSENCEPSAIVYAPDFFDEIKTYFRNLPDQDKTYDFVQGKFGAYLDYCEKPDPDGSYVCNYDLRGDRIYPIAFFFDKDGLYYRIIANIGGS